MRRLLRGLIAAIGALVLVAATLVLVTLSALQSRWVRGLAVEIALEQLNAQIRGEVEVDAIEGDLLHTVGLVGVTIRDPDGNVALELDRIDVEVELPSLLHRSIHVAHVRVEGADLTLLDQPGHVRIARAFEAKEPSEPEPPGEPWLWSIQVDDLKLLRSRFALRSSGRALELDHLRIAGRARIAPDGVWWHDVILEADAHNAPAGTVALRSSGGLAAGSLLLGRTEIFAGPHRLKLSGALHELSERLVAEARLESVEVDLGAIGDLVGSPLHGHVTAAGRIHGSLGDPLAPLKVGLLLDSDAGRIVIDGQVGLGGELGPEYDLRIETARLRVSRVLETFREPVALDMVARVQGAGDPTGSGWIVADLLIDGATLHRGPPLPLPIAARVDMVLGGVRAWVDAYQGESRAAVWATLPDLAATAGTATVLLRDIALEPWGKLLGQSGLGGRVHTAKGRARFRFSETAPPELAGDVTLDATLLRLPASLVGEGGLAATRVLVRSELEWPPDLPLPLGTLSLRAQRLEVAGARVAVTGVEASLTRTDKGLRARGHLQLEEPRYAEDVAAARVEGPFDLLLSPDDMGALPTGKATIRATGVRAADIRARRVAVTARVRERGLGLGISGPFSVAGLAVGRDLRIAGVSGRTDLRLLPATRSLSGTLGASMSGLTQRAGMRIREASTNLSIRVPSLSGKSVHAKGTIEVAGLEKVVGEVGAAGVTATIDGGLRNGQPIGKADGVIRELTSPGGDIRSAVVRVNIERPGRARLLVALQRQQGMAAIKLDIAGKLDGRHALQARIAGGSITSRFQGFVIKEGGTIGFHPVTGDLAVTGLTVQDAKGSARLTSSVRWRPKAQELGATVEATQIPIRRWVGQLSRLGLIKGIDAEQLGGILNVKADLDGTLREPVLHVEGTLRGGRVAHLEQIETEVEARADARGIQATLVGGWKVDDRRSRIDIAARTPARLRLTGERVVSMDTPVTARIAIERVRMKEFQPWLKLAIDDVPIAGELTGQLRLTGTPRRPMGVAKLLLSKLALGALSDAELQLDAGLSHGGARINVRLWRRRAVAGPGGEGERGPPMLRMVLKTPVNLAELLVKTGGGVAMYQRLSGAPVTVETQLAPTRLADLPYAGSLGDLRQARAAYRLQARGTFAAPTLSGWLQLTEIPLGATTAQARLTLDNQGATMVGNLTVRARDSEVLEATWRAPKALERVIAGEPQALLDDNELSVLVDGRIPSRALAPLSPDLSSFLRNAVDGAELTVTAVMRGGPQRRVGLQASVRSVHPKARQEEQGLARQIRIAGQLDRRTSRLRVALLQGERGGHLTLSAATSIGLDTLIGGTQELGRSALAGRLKADGFDLAGLHRALPTLFGPSRGLLVGDARLKGTVADPRIDGNLEARFTRMNIAALGLSQPALTVGIAFRDRKAVLEMRELIKGKGSMKLGLEVGLASLDPNEMDVRGHLVLKNFRLLDRRDAQVTLKTKGDGVRIKGTVAAPDIRGKLTVVEGELRPKGGGSRKVRQVGLPDDVVLVAKLGNKRRPPPQLAQAGRPYFDLEIEIPRRSLRIENEMLNVHLAGDVALRTRSGQPVLKGVIKIVGGHVVLFSRELELDKESTIRFSGKTAKVDPALNIKAIYYLKDVDLSGIGLTQTDTSNISVTVTGTLSEPELELDSDPKMDDTNILSILATGRPVGGASDPDAARGQALNLLISLALGSMAGWFHGRLPVDLRVEAGSEGLSDAKIRVGRRITRDLVLYYYYDAGADDEENEHEGRLEYEILPQLILETRYGSAGEGGVDLTFRWRF